MRITSSILALGAAAAAAAATLVFASGTGNDTTENHVVGPFALRITGKTNSSINGYGWACRAGAAIEGICYESTLNNSSGSGSAAAYEFYYNYTTIQGYDLPGSISYVGRYEGEDGVDVEVAGFMYIYPNWASNVHTALLPPTTQGGTALRLDYDSALFYMGSLDDDRHWNATPPSGAGEKGVNVTSFHLCYQWTGGYWRQSLAWVSGLDVDVKPQNPSCEPVNLGVEGIDS
ncbi:hypothetical protein GGS20DRAFT_374324 [Poronia punctata]|nr:hypothetical protein GGS20DRAFT_374324 [Poronia punctata]